jgi:hypothetical protein
MQHFFSKAMAAIAVGGFTVSPALAITPLTLDSAASIVIFIQDEENQELQRDLETDEIPSGLADAMREGKPCVPAGDKDPCGPGFHCQPAFKPGTGFCTRDK